MLTKGKPLIAKPITLVSKTGADPYLYFEAKTNLLGRFKITDVPDGEYCLLLRENNRDSVFRMKRVRVEAGKSEYNKISLEGVSLAGEVLDKRGVPVSGAHVQIGFPFLESAPPGRCEPMRTAGFRSQISNRERTRFGRRGTRLE